jgi:hypothetical protein
MPVYKGVTAACKLSFFPCSRSETLELLISVSASYCIREFYGKQRELKDVRFNHFRREWIKIGEGMNLAYRQADSLV